MHFLTKTFFSVALMICALATSAFAQTTTLIPPTGLSARTIQVSSSVGFTTTNVELTWRYAVPTGSTQEFAVYQANSRTENMADFRRIASVITRRADSLIFTLPNMANGTYTFYITAVSGTVESPRSAIVSVTVSNTIVIPRPAETCATISGRVLYNDGVPVTTGVVSAIPFVRTIGTTFVMPANAEIRPDGSYSLRVAASTYLVLIAGRGLPTTFSPATTSSENAGRVVVACGQTSTANITVTRPRTPQIFTVSGRVVIRGSGGQPLANAIVSFVPTRLSRPNESLGSALEMIGTSNGIMNLSVRTDAQGNYSTRLTDDFIYTAIASSAPGSRTEYEQQWFRGVSNPTEATPLTLTANRTDVNFELSPRRAFNNGISGSVRGIDGSATTAIISALRVARAGDTIRTPFTRTTESNVSGEWRVTNLLPGDYVVFAAPREARSPLAPGYYRAATTATNRWDDATRIGVGDVMPAVQYSIVLPLRSSERGIGRIAGAVNESASGTSLANTTPLAGAFVSVLDDEGRMVDYGFSSGTGDFDLSELTDGTYRIIAEKVNFRPVETSVTVDYAQANTNMQLSLRGDGTLTSVAPSIINNAVMIAPNPAEGITFISVPASTQAIGQATRISIMNMLGKEMMSIAIQGMSGSSLPVDVSTLSPGAYIIRVHTNTTILHGRLNIIR